MMLFSKVNHNELKMLFNYYLSLDRNAHLTAFHDAKRARDYLIET